MILYIDSSVAGISGDMVLGALLDLGGKVESLIEVGRKVEEKTGTQVRIEVRDVRKKGMRAKRVKVAAEGSMGEEALRNAAASLSIQLGLSRSARGFAEKALETIFTAEKRVHATGRAHLHEVGSADTLVDVLGAGMLLDGLGFFDGGLEVYASPVAIGSGEISTRHGVLPVPPPVTAEIIREMKIPVRFVRAGVELATPTGMSILSGLSPIYGYPPFPVRIRRIGVGAGGYDLKAMPNVLRIMVLGAEPETERIAVLKTSVDDVPGEVLGYLMERMYEEGALDVQIMPTVTKKNRPGYVIVVLCGLGKELEIAEMLMLETGSLGVRISTDQMRYVAEREVREVRVSLPGYEGTARVKISTLGGRRHIKAEFEDARRIARIVGLPLREVLKRIEEAAKKTI
jgi:hypothetical protein